MPVKPPGGPSESSGATALAVLGLSLDVTAGASGRSTPVVRDVELRVSSGEAVGLVGDSGSGKTLTALAVMGLLPAGIVQTSGAVELGSGERPAMIFQEPRSSLNPLLSVGYQIGEVLSLRGHRGRAKRRRTVDLLRRVALPDPEQRVRAFPHQLSGGQCQRVALAMALAAEPKLLIADEPTTALDVSVQAQILRLLETLRREEGLSLLLITHDLALVAATCDRVAVMAAGRIVEAGCRRQIFESPSHSATRRLLDAARLET
ncbi:MAG: ABC transporter ATP-binding protein [Acidobacteriota bacterium]